MTPNEAFKGDPRVTFEDNAITFAPGTYTYSETLDVSNVNIVVGGSRAESTDRKDES